MTRLRNIAGCSLLLLGAYTIYSISSARVAEHFGVTLPRIISAAKAAPRPAHAPASRSAVGLNEEFRCLAQNVYWEARSEPELGKVAVAKVTLNRVASGGFPSTICGVVRQGGSKVRSRCQFSWYCDGKSDEPDEAEAWHKAQQIASQALFYTIEDPTGGALWFHATYVRPAWAHSKVVTLRVGRHIYYASRVMPRPGRP